MTLKPPKRSNKHAPLEISSKKPQSRRRQVVQGTKTEGRDPRFDSLCGQFDQNHYQKNYSFLEDYQKSELEMIRKQIKDSKNLQERDLLKKAQCSMESRQMARDEKNRTSEILREQRAKEKELVKHGKKPFYLKKSEQKLLILQDKFSRLQETSSLEKVLERRRRKNSTKQKQRLPFNRC